MYVDEENYLFMVKRPSVMGRQQATLTTRTQLTLIHLANSRLSASHRSMLVSGLLLTFTRNPSCLMNQSLYTVHSASFSAISISKRSTSSGMNLFISINEMFLPRQVRGPRPNCYRQLTFTRFILFAAFFLSRK